LLIGADTGQVFRMTFEVIDSVQYEALGNLHSALATGTAVSQVMAARLAPVRP
jgi:hypothetical protein